MYLNSGERERICREAQICTSRARIVKEIPENTKSNETIKKYIDMITQFHDMFESIDSKLDDEIMEITDIQYSTIVDTTMDKYNEIRKNFMKTIEGQGNLEYKLTSLEIDYPELVKVYDKYVETIDILDKPYKKGEDGEFP